MVGAGLEAGGSTQQRQLIAVCGIHKFCSTLLLPLLLHVVMWLPHAIPVRNGSRVSCVPSLPLSLPAPSLPACLLATTALPLRVA